MSRNPFQSKDFACRVDDGFPGRTMAIYPDYAETRAQRHQSVIITQWAEKLDAFLQFDEHELVMNLRKVEAGVAKCLTKDCGEISQRRDMQSIERRR